MKPTTYHILSQHDGSFLGAAEIDDDGFINLWSDGHDVDTTIYIFGDYENDDALYAEIVDSFCFEGGYAHDDVYLTDELESKILYAA